MPPHATNDFPPLSSQGVTPSFPEHPMEREPHLQPPVPAATELLEQEATSTAPSTTPHRKLRVAVIGSGLAGLTAAHLLSSLHSDDGHGEAGIEVELFEKAHKLGMDAASLSVTCPCQKCALEAGRSDGDPKHEHIEGRMDVPMRSFFPEYYPNLVRLYRSIGVKFHDADNTLACFDVAFNGQACPSSDPDHPESAPQSTQVSTDKPSLSSAQLNTNVNIEDPYLSSRSYKVSAGHTITLPDLPPLSVLNPYPFARRLLGYYRIARDYVRMLAVSKEFMTQGRMIEIGKDPSEWGNGRQASLREFLVSGGYSHDFSAFFVPLFACVCTCSFDRMMEYPACVVLEYVARCMPFGRMQFVSSGVREVTENLSQNIQTIHFNTLIEKIVEADETTGDKSGPVVLIDSNGVHRSFDHVIFATQANQAATMLAGQGAGKLLPKPFVTTREKGEDESNFGQMEDHYHTDPETPKNSGLDATPETHPFFKQVKTLAKFPYERTQVVCHTDTSFLPKDPAAWRLLNIAKSTTADILASPFDSVSNELEHHRRQQQQQKVNSGIFSTATSFFTRAKEGSAGSGPYRRKPGTLEDSAHSLDESSPLSSRTVSGQSTPLLSTSTVGPSTPTSTTASVSHNSAMATHIMNSTALSLGSTTKFLQTTNPIFQPRSESVISSAWFERAVVNPESMKAVDELQEQMDEQAARLLAQSELETKLSTEAKRLSPGTDESVSTAQPKGSSISDRVWLVGSYAYPGIPLLEGCVVSSLQVMDRIVATVPDRKLTASVSAPEGSFLKRDAPMRERRRYRAEKHWDELREAAREELRVNSQVRTERSKGEAVTASVEYFERSWKDTLEDEAIWQEQELRRERQVQQGSSPAEDTEQKGSSWLRWTSKETSFSVGSWTSNVYLEVLWMLALYLMAIAQWWMVFVLESFGVDGGRWALA